MNGLAGVAVVAVTAPLWAALLGLLTARGSRSAAAALGVLGAGVALVAALLEASHTWAGTLSLTEIPLLGSVDTGVGVSSLSLRADATSGLVAVAVAAVALAVQVYSAAYLHGDDDESAFHSGAPAAPSDGPTRYPAYACTVSLFTGAMMGVVHADNLFLLLVGWEVMGLCSYLLVGHHSERRAARAAAVKAFLVTRVGDVGFLLGIVVLVADTGSPSLSGLLRTVADGGISSMTATLASLLLIIGVIGKSAQFPLHTWLPDAMEGPTPVSALIHAATMVAAGVVVLVRLASLLAMAPAALALLAVVTSVSMVGAALAALAAVDLKRLLAWSTISQVALMLSALSLGSASGPPAALSHLLSHAAFKALLFLAAGVVTHLVGSTLLRDMGGLLRSSPAVAVCLALGLAALAGVPPLSGFVSKESVLTAAEEAALSGDGVVATWAAGLVLLAGLVTTALTGAYAARALAVVVLRPDPLLEPSGDDVEQDDAAEHDAAEHDGEHAATTRPTGGVPVSGAVAISRTVPAAMRWPVLLLAVPTVLLGALPLLGPAALEGAHLSLGTSALGTVLALTGVLVGWSGGGTADRDLAGRLPRRLRRVALSGFGMDRLQSRLVARPLRRLAGVVAAGDEVVLDGYVRGAVIGTTSLGRGLRLLQTGSVPAYLSWVLGAAVGLGVLALAVVGAAS